MGTPFFPVSFHQKYSNRYESTSCLNNSLLRGPSPSRQRGLVGSLFSQGTTLEDFLDCYEVTCDDETLPGWTILQPSSICLSSIKTSCGRFLNQFKIANLDFSPEKTVSIKSSLCFVSGEYSCLVASKSLSRDCQWPKRTITQLKTRFILSCYNEFEQTYINLCRYIGSTFGRLAGRSHSVCQCLSKLPVSTQITVRAHCRMSKPSLIVGHCACPINMAIEELAFPCIAARGPPLAATYQLSEAEMRRRRLVAIRIPHETNGTAEAGFHVVVSCSQTPIIYKSRPQRPNRFASVDSPLLVSSPARLRIH
ncbi:Uncharacterized protein LW94_908 [Fusarium fujikuroi]|nr:Uncharacterized protein Y057_5494 [Fusarium fujikuroi]KLP13341.1 Uncharacterized protein LW94_908 [Fusarium fujikuroi]